MPTYRIETNRGTFEIEANRAPTVAEIEAFAANAGAGQVAQPPPARPRSGVVDNGQDFAPSHFDGYFDAPARARAGAVANAATNMGLRGGAPAAGQAVGAMTGPFAPVAVPVLGAVGGMGGEALAQLREGEGFSPGAILGAGVAGAVPGGSLAKAGLGKVAKEGGKALAGNVAAQAVETGVDEGRLPNAAEAALAGGAAVVGTAAVKGLDKGVQWAAAKQTKALQNAIRDQVLAEARAAGYVIPPSKVNSSFVNNVLESIAGKAATAQEAAARNQEITNALVRKAIGAPPEAPLTESMLRQIRKEAAAPYEEISQMALQGKKDLDTLKKNRFTVSDPHEREVLMNDPETVKEMSELAIRAGADVEALKRARYEANAQYTFHRRSGDPKALARARTAEELAGRLEDKIEEAAVVVGRPELVDQLRAARVRIAKAHQVEQALNLSDANVSAPILGRSFDKGAPLNGPLKTVAQFQQAFPAFAREGATVPAPGVSKLNFVTSLGLGAGGYAAAGPTGLLAATIPLMDGPMRKLVLSPSYQRIMGQPFSGTDMPDFIAQAAQQAARSAGRRPINQQEEAEP